MSGDNGKKKSGCGYGCLLLAGIVAAVGCLVFIVLVVIGSVAASPLDDGATAGSSRLWKLKRSSGRDEFPEMEEVWSAGSGSVKVVRIPLRGMIALDNDGWSPGSTAVVLRSIRRATRDSEVKGIILEIDSGGGEITASDIVYKALVEFKESQEGRVVVAMMMSVAASGAYYVALPADCIIAHPTTITGSIGVVRQSFNLHELTRKIGVHDVTIKSAENKDLFNPFSTYKEEHGAIMQEIINEMHQRFAGLVAEWRKLPADELARLTDGRVVTAQQALEGGLIDQIGYRQDAESRIAELLSVDGVKIYRYEDGFSLAALFSRPMFGADSGFKQLKNLFSRETQLMYRWQW